jgi:ribonucleoside-triphosphate reductase
MHGGQSFGHFDRDLAPYFANATDDECYQAMEALIYNLNSMHSRAGAQVPFSSLNLGTDTSEAGRRVTKNLLLAYMAGMGHHEQPIWPNIIFRVKEGVNFEAGTPNHDLLMLALEVAGGRMNPTFSFMDSSFNKEYGDDAGYMGCRTRVVANVCGPSQIAGRGNLSFTTLNLPGIALEHANHSKDSSVHAFIESLGHYIDLVIEQLLHRFEIQAKLKVKDMPFLMGQGLYLDSEKLGPDDEIREVIKHGTLSIGFCGLAECLKVLTGSHHGEDKYANIIGHRIISYLRDRCDQATEQYGLNFTLLATPAESTAGRFALADQKQYGVIEGVNDRGYYTNSFHVPVHHQTDPYTKINIEGPYHKYCNAGHISYVESASAFPSYNLQAMYTILKVMKEADMGYAGFNFPIDHCLDCQYSTGIFDTCPNCGSTSVRRIRRITGYLSTTDLFNDSKRLELEDRVIHK